GACKAEDRADRGLDRPKIVEEFGEGVGCQIGRDGEGQHECPGEDFSAGEIVSDDKPGRGDTDDSGAERYKEEQQKGVTRRLWQDIWGQMRPICPGPGKGDGDDRQDGDENDSGDGDRAAKQERQATTPRMCGAG